ncbi:MAG TPA: YIP1 family protein [Steroidobacteraceae bacterium]|nr:YIP1 family protein [Steroidobacteraceae bacterium]
MSTPEPIRPIKDVWLRPRRVFRELASRPVGATDYLLAAIQGIATSIIASRTQLSSSGATAEQILGTCLLLGPLGGIFSLYVFAAIYGRLGKRAGGNPVRNQVFHVLAYGGVPLAASLLPWAFTVLIVGEAAITNTPGAGVDGFVAFMLRAPVVSYMLLQLWTVILQVMGFSEIMGLAVRKAFAVWVLGQLLGLLAYLFLLGLIGVLLPGLAPSPH